MGMVTITAKEGREDELTQLLGEMAAVAKLDDGTEIYAVHRSRKDPRVHLIYELYRDKDALKRHQANPKLAELGSGLRELSDSTEVVLGNLVGGDRPTRA
jgi:quinol monooxygenase YgiN